MKKSNASYFCVNGRIHLLCFSKQTLFAFFFIALLVPTQATPRIPSTLTASSADTPAVHTLSPHHMVSPFSAHDNAMAISGNEIPQRTISGTVQGNDNAPLPGAAIVVKGTSTGTTTDVNGKYTLNCDCPEGTILVFSFVGFETQEIPLGDSNTIDVTLKEGVELSEVVVLGSRGRARTDVDRAVPVDIISSEEMQSTAQPDVAQSLHFSAPSFSAVKFGINDLAPLVDPATLRGMAPDQTLLLVNGKRRHKVAFFSVNDGIGKGQLANDMNVIPAAAIDQVSILRDGAAAQYGSDAIAGVINMGLKKNRSGGSIRTYFGTAYSSPKHDDKGDNANLNGQNIYNDVLTDGRTFSTSLNFGLPWGKDGFVSTTLNVFHADAYDRSGVYNDGDGSSYYTDEQVAASGAASSTELLERRGVELDRAILGGAQNTNGGVFINAGKPINEMWDFYAFGGLTVKEIVGGVFTRQASRADRSALDIFYDGYNPEVPSNLTDWQLVSGFKADLGSKWKLDISAGYSGNDLQLFARNTVNPSLGVNSPTQFYTGGLKVTQTVLNADVVKQLGENTTLAFGAESRFESFEQMQGEVDSWRVGPLALDEGKDVGSSGREGYRPESDGIWFRNNTGIYVEAESDITEKILLTGAVRFEIYSDFGSDFSYKAAGRYKFSDKLALRGSFNRSFRAPGLAQIHYSNFSQVAFDNDGASVVTPFLPVRDSRVSTAFGIDGLKPETSTDLAFGATSQLTNDLSLTLDVYQIDVNDRILVAGFVPANFPVFNNSGYDEVNIFTNALNTRTRGLDFVVNYKKAFSAKSRLRTTLGLNFNETTVEGFNLPSNLTESDLKAADIDYITRGTPRSKIILSGDYKIGKLGVILRFTYFGEVYDPLATFEDANGNDQAQTFEAKLVTDLSLVGYLGKGFTITAGVNNLFDVYPDLLIDPQNSSEVIYSRRTNQFGTQGRFFNLAIAYNWE